MKQFRKFFYFLGIIVLAVVVVCGFFTYKNHGLRNELGRAKLCYENGDMANAVSILETVYQKTPHSKIGEEAAYLLGKSYINLSELEKAEGYWNILKSKNKEKYAAECLFNLGIIYKLTDRLDLAVSNYEQLIKDYHNSNLLDDAMLNLAVIHKEKGELEEAQKELMSIAENYPESNLIGAVEKELGSINVNLLLSSKGGEGAEEYTVKGGDSLYTIAQHFGTTVELVKKCNNLKTDFIKPGDKLKIITNKFSIIVDKSQNILTLKSGENVVKVYRAGTGVGGCTPTGTFIITNKLVNPPWHKPGAGVVPFGDPKNVLGTRWMGFNKAGYGIHGTWEPESIGKQASAGCVRLQNDDVEELFQLAPVGTEVTIVE